MVETLVTLDVQINDDWTLSWNEESKLFDLTNKEVLIGAYSSIYGALLSYVDEEAKYNKATDIGKLFNLLSEVRKDIQQIKWHISEAVAEHLRKKEKLQNADK